MMPTNKRQFSELIQTGSEAENKFEAVLLWNKKKYCKIGQENWLPRWVHQKLRFCYDLEVEVLRHIPDFATDKSLIQVKHAPDCTDYPTVTIQRSSHHIANFYVGHGIPVLITWLFPDKKFYGNWAENISVEESSTNRHELNGSQTPMYLVRKHQLVLIAEFMNDI